MNWSAHRALRTVLVLTLLDSAAMIPAYAQGLPGSCYQLLEGSSSTISSLGGPVGSSIPYETLIAQALQTGDEPWSSGLPMSDAVTVIDSLHRVNSVLTEGVLASIVTDLNRYGSGIAIRAAFHFRRVSGRAPVMISALLGALAPNRVLIGLGALRPGLSEMESRGVAVLACQAAWALEAFTVDSRFGHFWSTGLVDNDWPAQNDYILIESARILTGEWRSLVLELLDISGSAARVPEYEKLVR